MKKAMIRTLPACLAVFLLTGPPPALGAVVEYDLVIAEKEVDYTGRTVEAMTVNGKIPGPTLRFKVGDTARIRVRNDMPVSTSIHWHGVLVPPGMDGVPNVSFPPIASGTTFTYEFPIRHAGTYWYHSHSGLQEQRGVYGSLVLEPEKKRYHVDGDHVILLSDWTDDDPHAVLRTLKRGSEWYALEKGSAQSIIGAIRAGKSGDYWGRELSRMPAMDIADVAYDRFLANGMPETTLRAGGGQTVRLRLIDGSATTYFHLQFAGGGMRIIAADGQDVEPVEKDIFLIGVAETYDVLVRVPEDGSWELRATAHDGSGFASVWIGEGERNPAPDLPRPNLYNSMMEPSFSRVFALTPAGSMGMPDRKVKAGRFDSPGMNMEMNMEMDMGAMGSMGQMGEAGSMGAVEHPSTGSGQGGGMGEPAEPADAGTRGHGDTAKMTMESKGTSMVTDQKADEGAMDTMKSRKDSMQGMAMDESMSIPKPVPPMTSMQESPDAMMGMVMNDSMKMSTTVSGTMTREGRMFGKSYRYMAADVSSSPDLAVDGMGPARPMAPYRDLRATRSTAVDENAPIREVRLTLDGDMERYVWFLNNKPLSETDSILIRKGERVRFIMINRTMMHHPMHLHGHFFRVINGQGDRSPLKHTVDVAPMTTTVIEFAADEAGDWFFHCHLLYHMKSGMARLIHYEGFDPGDDVNAVRPRLYEDSWYFWGHADALSNMTEGALVAANTRNTFMLQWESGWEEVPHIEREYTLTWDLYINRFTSFFVGADHEKTADEKDTRGVLGLRYLLPLNIEAFAWVDDEGDNRYGIEKEFMLSPRTELFGEVQFDNEEGWEGNGGFSFLMSKGFSVLFGRHSEYEWGAGIQLRF